jgi:cell division protein FtsZ
VQGITDLITTPGLINLDFADVKSVMSGAGSALMGIGSSRGDDRSVAAAEMAISSPLLEASIDGAHGVLLSIQGGSDLGLFEINEAAQLVANSAAPDANIIFGAVIDDALGDEVRVTVIAAGFDESQNGRPRGARPALTYPAAPAVGSDAFGSPWHPAPTVAPRPQHALGDQATAAAQPYAASEEQTRPYSSAGGYGAATSYDAGSGQVANGTGPAQPGAGGQSAGATPPADLPAEVAGADGQATAQAGRDSRQPAAGDGGGHMRDSTSTRRRSVVFEEDDELDVPDFLK